MPSRRTDFANYNFSSSTSCWNNYFNSYLQVVHRLSITTSGYVLNAYMLSSAIISPLVAG